MVDFRNEIVRNMKQRVRTPEFLNRVIKVYDFTTLFSRLMMYRRAKSSLVQPKKEGEEERDVATDVIATRKMITTMMTMTTRNTNVVNGREEDANVKRKKRKWRGREDASARE